MFWVNGEPGTHIPLSDRSFQYGDGCFTTILTCSGEIQLWSEHIARMEACLSLLSIPCPNWFIVETWLRKAAFPSARAGLKLHVSRGEGGRGYSPHGLDTPTITISAFSYPQNYDQWRAGGIRIGVCEQRLGLSPLLAGHKHNNRLEQVLLRNEMDQRGFSDGLVRDINGKVIETSMANVFWVSKGVLFTPVLDQCGVAGVMRSKVLECAKRARLDVHMGEFDIPAVYKADEVFICNSLLGVAPVAGIENQSFPVGNMTRYFQEKLNS